MNTLVFWVQYFFVDLLGGLARFPLWWYSGGLRMVSNGIVRMIDHYRRTMAIGVWAKNLFVPMYGLRDIQGRVISFFMRLFQIFFRSFLLIVWTSALAVVFLFYLAFPVIAGFFFLFHLSELLA